MPSVKGAVARMDRVVNEFVARCRWFHEPMTRGRAKMFVMQHRLNTRQRNSVLKLKVATNCTDWDTRIRIIQACSEEVIADHEHGGGRPHWAPDAPQTGARVLLNEPVTTPSSQEDDEICTLWERIYARQRQTP